MAKIKCIKITSRRKIIKKKEIIRKKDNADNATDFFVFDEIYFFIGQL